MTPNDKREAVAHLRNALPAHVEDDPENGVWVNAGILRTLLSHTEKHEMFPDFCVEYDDDTYAVILPSGHSVVISRSGRIVVTVPSDANPKTPVATTAADLVALLSHTEATGAGGLFQRVAHAKAMALADRNSTAALKLEDISELLALAALSQPAQGEEALLDALHDAIRRPMGVVPDSAAPFYDPKRADAAEARRAFGKGDVG